MTRTQRHLAAIAVAILALASSSIQARAADDKIVVSSKLDTEGALLGNMIAILLARHGLAVEDKIQLGPTKIVRSALLAGQIDIYPEYTGNGAFFFHRESDPVWKDAVASHALVETLDRDANKLHWLAAAPADNTWGLAVRGDLAKAHNLATVEDFANYVRAGGKVKLAASIEFIDSPAALPTFEAVYGFKLVAGQMLALAGGDTAATIRAAAEGNSGVNVTMAYGTDGALAALGLVLLADDRHAQIVYEPCPVVRGEVLNRHPEIASILDPPFRSLSAETLRRLNARIAVDGEDAKEVAADYLKQKGFIEPGRDAGNPQ